jgi:hypothetical protein
MTLKKDLENIIGGGDFNDCCVILVVVISAPPRAVFLFLMYSYRCTCSCRDVLGSYEATQFCILSESIFCWRYMFT